MVQTAKRCRKSWSLGRHAADRGARPLYLLDPAIGEDRLLGTLEQVALLGLTVSPDGKTILYSKLENQGSELMMIENFR